MLYPDIENSSHKNNNLPWVQLRTFFRTSDNRPWAYVQLVDYVDILTPLCTITGAPYVHQISNYQVIPVDRIHHLIQVIKDSRLSLEEMDNLWINWWYTTGNAAYDENHRWETQESLHWWQVDKS